MPKFNSACKIGARIEKEMLHLKFKPFTAKRHFNTPLHLGSFRNVAEFCSNVLNVDVDGNIITPTLNELTFDPLFDLGKSYDVYLTEADAFGNYYYEIFKSLDRRSNRLRKQKFAAMDDEQPFYRMSFGIV